MEFIEVDTQRKEGNRDNENKDNQFSAQQGLMTFEEVRKYLRTTKMALRRRMEEGMPCFKVGNQWRYQLAEINAWLAAQN